MGTANATDVILTGGSSGGMAVFLNCDRVAAMIGAVNPDVRVTCLADVSARVCGVSQRAFAS